MITNIWLYQLVWHLTKFKKLTHNPLGKQRLTEKAFKVFLLLYYDYLNIPTLCIAIP